MTGGARVRMVSGVPIGPDQDAVTRTVNLGKAVERQEQAIRKNQSKKGKLKLPKLLDERRLQYAMPDGCFRTMAQYDRILVWQISAWDAQDGKSSETSNIIIPDEAQKRERQGMPRGIIVSAGLKALDTIRSNGMDLGHIIGFVQHSVFRRPVQVIEGQYYYLHILRDGDILDSEDTQRALQSGRIQIRYDDEQAKHYYYDVKDKKRFDPRSPWLSDEL